MKEKYLYSHRGKYFDKKFIDNNCDIYQKIDVKQHVPASRSDGSNDGTDDDIECGDEDDSNGSMALAPRC